MVHKSKIPSFATGPVKKQVNWVVTNPNLVANIDIIGRSHRSSAFLTLTQAVINKIKNLLNIPPDYKIITLTGGATAAVEMALWNFVGANPIDCISWEFFGNLWIEDIVDQLKIKNANLHTANFGEYPNLDKVDFTNNDVLLVHSGSTSGVIFKDEDKIPLKREGLIINDATSYIFMYEIDWLKFDVIAFSWQKVLASEAAHGMLILSPRAINRLKTYNPTWPIPKIFRLKTREGNLIEELFDTGLCLNTPSALAFIDVNCNLDLIQQSGGVRYIHKKVDVNYNTIENWVDNTPWIKFVVQNKQYRSKVIVCLEICDPQWKALPIEIQKEANHFIITLLEKNNIAYDIGMYRLSPIIGFRLWLGPTIEEKEIVSLTKGLELAYLDMKKRFYKYN